MAGTELMHARSQSMNGIHHDSVIPEIKMEQPNGTVKGHAHSLSHPVSRPTNNMPSTSTIITAEPPQTPAPPVLPQSMNGMVSLGAIIHRMTNEAFADLSNTSEILPSMADPQKKHTLLDFTLSKREQFIKLLVLTKWAKSATKVQQCQNIIGFLQHENELFARAVGGLFETYKTFGRARVRNYDIPTAIDVLTTGSYQRLPTTIKQTYVGEEKPTRTEIAAALEKLDDVIRMRLLCDELVPPGMKYTIAKGKAKFVVPKEFEVTLTIPGPGSPEDIPWRIVGLKLLVKPVGGSFQGLEISLNDLQMRAIMMAVQRELEAGSTPPIHLEGAPNTTPKVPANQALLRLYDYLHTMAQHLQLELVHTQAVTLIQSGWTDRLRLGLNQGSVRLVYWLTGHSPQSGPIQPVRRASTLPSAQAKEALQEHFLEFRIEEQAKVQQIPEGLAGALVDPKLLGYPKSQIKVVWSQVVKGFVSQEEADIVLDMDPSNLNTERLILKAVNMHAGQVMQGFYDRLWTYIENLKGPGQEGGYFSKDDVKLESVETEDPSSSSALSAGPQALLVRLKGDRWIRIRIDVRSGRVVVQEVGKTGDFDDPVISAFQSRLNENANNIVESLINLRFSMSIVELESVGVQLGLQPSKPLALSKQDMDQFGENTQQLLYLQYPQHPRHYLVVGVIAHKFCVWLIEVAPMEKEIQGVWLTLKSIVPVYWQSLREKLNRDEDETMSRRMPSKRKSVQFDVTYEEDDDPSHDEELTIDQELLTKLEALCRVRICHNEVKRQLQEHGIQFRHLPSSRIKDETSPKSDTESSESLLNNVPLLRIDPNSISPGSTEGTFQSVGAKLTGWWDSQRETCNIVIQAKFFPDVIPPNMDSGPLSASEHYYSKTNTLSFTYKTRGSFIEQFKQDWETISRMLRVIRQLHAPTLTNPHIKLDICHLHQVQLQYFGRYSINIKWVAAQQAEKRSSSGQFVIPSAPRFKLGRYELLFGEVKPQKKETTPTKPRDGTDLYVNPHRRIKYFLQDMFNREADLHSLMNTVIQTCSILEVLDRLEHTVKEDATGTKMLSVVPRSAHHIRVVYGSKYALDIRAFSRTHISIFDASFPSESFGSSLPPPPAPSTAAALLTPPGRVIPATTRGHLNYSAIVNLQGVIGAIDVEKDDEEYIRSTMVAPSPASQAPGPAPTLSTAAIIAAAKSNLKKEAAPMVSMAAATALHHAIDPRDEPYEIMPMPNGVICSRSASGRVMFRIAKHIDSLVPL
ncbi:MAG: mediator complex subunit MED14-domain-containing protein [Podila humilis]|nr:MAG: mediator complex subunit MED14-domain-containing protein [Podila humilis]